MDSCCDSDAVRVMATRQDQRRVLVAVLLVNAALFLVELSAGLITRSTALLGDSLDMLGDSLVYGFSLYVLKRSDRARTYAALLKGAIMVGFGLLVLGEAASKLLSAAVPSPATMGIVSLMALAGNGFCFWLLYRHRATDINMRSAWLCSRNDLIANVSVMVAALLVAVTGSGWPDIAVGTAIAALFLWTAVGVLRDARRQLLRLRAAAVTVSDVTAT
jgi:cation diffusion facilitator family transporter